MLHVLNATTAWTILAPTSDGIAAALTALNLTREVLLADNALLLRILSFHVIPSGAVPSSGLTSGQTFPTALAGAPALTVTVGDTVTFAGPTNTVTVVAPDIIAGASVIHVVDGVLVPPAAA